MAYFSNGTEGDIYEAEYCDRCIHQDGCAVWELHMIHNSDQHDDERLASILGTLIPRSKDGTANHAAR